MHVPDSIRDLFDRPLVVALVVAASLGIGMLVLQRWVADTRAIAIVLVGAWFALVLIAALAATRDDSELRRAAVATIGAIAAATVVVGYWTGFRETTVDENVAIATTRANGADLERRLSGAAPDPTPAKPGRERDDASDRESEPEQEEGDTGVELAGAAIRGADGHAAKGTATVVEMADGTRVLTLTDFEADPGPDVDVYLSADSAGVDDAINLGDLKGTNGNQQYEIPADADLTRYRALVLWCIPFTTRIATAELLG